MISRYLITVVLLLLAAGALRAQGEGNDAPRSSPLEGLEKIEPAGSRSEADDDRRAARVHFLQARLDLGRDDKAAALRHYQRAWRWDPQQPELLREIASLAFELKRGEEAARYAVLAAEHDPQDALLMRRLAAILTKGRDWSRAIRLYELAERMESRRRKPDGKPDLSELTIRLEMGRLYFLTGDFEKSAAAFAVIRDALLDSDSELSADARELLVGKPGETWALWAEAFLSARRFDEAEALFRKSHEARADAATLAFQLARVAAQRGDAAAAIARLDEYFAERSSVAGIEPYDLLAELNAKRLPDKAAARQATIDRLAKLAKDDGDNLALKRALAGQYYEAERLADAQPLLAAVVADQPSADGWRKLAEIYRRTSRPEQLLALMADVASKSGSLDALGEAAAAIAADRPLVARLAELARQTPTDQANSGARLFAAGLLALQAEEFDAADELLWAAAAGTRPPKEAVLLRWGLGLMLAEQPARAVKVFQRIIDENAIAGDEASPHYYLAAALELSGRTEEALAAARRAAELKPDDARLATREAWVLDHADRDREAKAAYTALLAKFDARYDSPLVREAMREARLALSNIELELSDYPAAIERLQQVLDEFPEDIGAGNDLGYLWADRGEHLQRALALIERATAADPDNTAYRDSLGWIYFRLGRHEEAVRELTKAAAGEKPDGVILDHLGDALLKLGKRDEALAAFRRAEAAFQKAGQASKLEGVRKKIRE